MLDTKNIRINIFLFQKNVFLPDDSWHLFCELLRKENLSFTIYFLLTFFKKDVQKVLPMKKTILFITLLGLLTGNGWAQAEEKILEPKVAKYDYDAIPKDPLASACFSATIPGSGQAYNREYLRGVVTAVGFYASVYAFYYEVNRWKEINTDTFYVYEAFVTPPNVRPVYVPRTSENQVGLPVKEKVILSLSIAGAAGFYVWGILDSYNGAKRFNKGLLARLEDHVKMKVALQPKQSGWMLQTDFRF